MVSLGSMISISGPPSEISDVISVASLESQRGGDAIESHSAAQERTGTSSTPTNNIIPGCNGNPLFEPGDGDMKVWVNGVCFETHKYIIKRFGRLKERLGRQPRDAVLILERDQHGVEDFKCAFKVLYASILEGPFQFDSPTLVSALRIATAYDYPALRTYAIERLEQIKPAPIERIRIAREFGLTSWKEPAFVELCARDEAITTEEAGILGLETFVRVAELREKVQRKRGKEVDGQMHEPISHSKMSGGNSNTPRIDERHATVGNNGTIEGGDSSQLAHDGSGEGETSGETSQVDGIAPPGTEMRPSFININAQPGGTYAYSRSSYYPPAPDCKCCFLNAAGAPTDRRCALAPCTMAAFKHLQIQQLAHANTIATLESAIDALATSTTASDPTPTRPALDDSIQSKVSHMLDLLGER